MVELPFWIGRACQSVGRSVCLSASPSSLAPCCCCRFPHSEEGSPKKAKGATLFLRETNEGVVTDTREEVSDTVNGLTFHYTAGSFFQVMLGSHGT